MLIESGACEVYFHPDYSCGTAAVRGNRQFCEGEMHYWEVKMSSTVYGTDMVHVIISIPKEMGVIHNFDNQFSILGM